MKQFLSIIKYDYLQRTRSYTFLITLCASLAIAYTFIPAEDASYSTIRIADYVGYYNSAWVGYVTAMMTSIFLSLIGFYLINSAVKTDARTRVGQIIAATPIRNFTYLLSKTISGFLVLLTLVALIFLMSILLFFRYGKGFDFELMSFLKPYLLIAIPSLFFISVLAVVFEVIFRKYTILQNVIFFFLFSVLMIHNPVKEADFRYDVFGSKMIIDQLETAVKKLKNSGDPNGLTIGYVIGTNKKPKKFLFEGYDFPHWYIISRILWMVLGICLLMMITPIFHRFGGKSYDKLKKGTAQIIPQVSRDMNIKNLTKIDKNFSIVPLLKTELLMMVGQGKKWLWTFNLLGLVFLIFLPMEMAHTIVLPVLWFLQVHRFSSLATKENVHNMHHFILSSYLPLRRVLVSQVIAALVFLLLLALPVLLRYLVSGDFRSILEIVLGALFLIFLSTLLGLTTKGKKLFEVMFFLLTYANLNKIPFLDYFGALPHERLYIVNMVITILLFGCSIFFIRKGQIEGN